MVDKIHKILSQIAAGTVTRKAAAIYLEVSTRTINRLMAKAGTRRPEGLLSRQRKKVALRKRTQYLVIKATIEESAEIPAKLLDISERTVYRLRKAVRDNG